MTQYTQADLEAEWEFKIVRSVTSAFHNPATLQRLVDEEARAGWVMLEKFDDNRVRFKRRRSARANDPSLPAGYDPYRTRFGMSDTTLALIIIGGLMVFFFLIIAIVSIAEA